MITYYVTILLNRTEDDEGRLAIFARFGNEEVYQSDDVLESVWSGNVHVNEDPEPAEDILNLVFEMFNRGAPRFIGDAEYPQRSLSVGDVIEIDECDRYVVENLGFKKLAIV